MKKMTVTGKTIEEAVQAGLHKWNVSRDQVEVRVIEQPSKGLFGIIGAKEAKVELERIPDPVEETMEFLHDVFKAMDLEVSIEPEEHAEHTTLQISGSNLGLVIGRRGQTLDALQYLTNIVANRRSNSYVRIMLDAERFRERRRETLEQLAFRLAERAVRTGKEIILEPMSPHDRKIIHATLQDHDKVTTYSKGDEPNRRIVITLV